MAGKLMHAVQYDGYGGGPAGLKHVEVPVPVPGKDEVLLKLEARSLNPVDWKIQKGMLRPLLPRKFPHIPGTDVAGEVVDVGPGVKNFKAGEKVVAKLSHAIKIMAEDQNLKPSSFSIENPLKATPMQTFYKATPNANFR